MFVIILLILLFFAACLFLLRSGKINKNQFAIIILLALTSIIFIKSGPSVISFISAGFTFLIWLLNQILNIAAVAMFFKSMKNRNTSSNQQGSSQKAFVGKMSREEALKILGLEGNPTDEQIKQAYKKIISKVHPDQGGSTYLASKINEAKDTLLKH